MAARAIWKGVVRFDPVAVPVKLYSAVQDRNIHFRLLHDQDMAPVTQKMINPDSGDEVPRDRIRKGAPVGSGRYVILTEEELAGIEPAASREIHITQFVPPSEINHQWYVRPYYLGPDGDDEAYWALATALAQEGREGVARWVMRKSSYIGALRAVGDYLMLITLRHAEEVVDPGELELPSGRKPSANETKMARQLVAALEEPFDPAAWKDEYRARVMDLVRRKAAGQKIELPRPAKRKKPADSLLATLEASVKAASREKVHA